MYSDFGSGTLTNRVYRSRARVSHTDTPIDILSLTGILAMNAIVMLEWTYLPFKIRYCSLFADSSSLRLWYQPILSGIFRDGAAVRLKITSFLV
uniref:7TM_GPCR_Srx domain-containing protein n=1 Tax=Ascaris lumbricoides TaxID=6252 RepID=A0A0M3I993_ASCLU